MANSHSKSARAAIVKDLVELHHSMVGTDAVSVPEPAKSERHEEAGQALPFELFVEHMPMGVLFANVVRDLYRHPIDFRVSGANKRYADLIGMSRLSVLESPFFDVIPGGRSDWAADIDAVALKGRQAHGIAKVNRTGRSLHVQLFLPRRDTLAVVLDEVNNPGLELRDSARERLWQMEQILATAPLLICRFRPGGEVTYANEAYLHFFETPQEKRVSHNYMTSIPADYADFVRSRIEMICRESPRVTYEAPYDLADGRRWVQWTDVGIFDSDQKLVAYESVGFEMTALKQQEQDSQRLAGRLRDLLSFQARRNRAHEGNHDEITQEQRTLAEDNRALKRKVKSLEALTIKGALQVCSRCSRIHDDKGNWMLPHLFLELRTAASVESSICPYCHTKAEREQKAGENQG